MMSCDPAVKLTCDAPASNYTGSQPLLQLVTWLRQTHSSSVRVECHTVSLCAFKAQQGYIILPALTVVLSVNDDAFWGQRAFKVILFHGVVVTET